MTVLLDTNVVSELRKIRAGRADAAVARWADRQDPRQLYLSAITIEEIARGVLLAARRDPKQGRNLGDWLDQRLLPGFSGRILPVDLAVARRAAALQVPDPRPSADALIAATALVHGLTLATRNTGDFAGTGLTVIDPWQAA